VQNVESSGGSEASGGYEDFEGIAQCEKFVGAVEEFESSEANVASVGHGNKELRRPVAFGLPTSVRQNIDIYPDRGSAEAVMSLAREVSPDIPDCLAAAVESELSLSETTRRISVSAASTQPLDRAPRQGISAAVTFRVELGPGLTLSGTMVFYAWRLGNASLSVFILGSELDAGFVSAVLKAVEAKALEAASSD
jgi:hypothetical protein